MIRLAVLLIFTVTFWTGHNAQTVEDVRQPPSILRSPLTSIVFRTDQKIELPCSASGSPKPTYEWWRNGERLNLNLHNIRRLSEGDIELQNAGPIDEGYYQCVAFNQYGAARSNTTVLQRAFQQDPPVATVSEKRVREGEPFQIDFVPLMSNPSPQYRWASADRSGLSQTDLVKSARMQWADNGNLFFSYAKLEDDLNDRIYKGLTFNPNVDISAGGSHTKVTVERVVGGVKQFRPILSFSSANTTIGMEGKDITLRCFFAGFPDPSIRWAGPKGRMPVARVTRQNSNVDLTISTLRQSDAGEYTCTGSNSRGETSQTIQLIVEAVPLFNDSFASPRNVNVTEGDSVTFQCNPYAKPRAEVVWMINGLPVDAAKLPARVSITGDGRNLTVHSVCRDCTDRSSHSDLMVVQCNASNQYGYAFGAGYLNVLKKTSVVLASDAKAVVETSEKQTVQFQCLPFSDPSTPVRTTWHRILDNDGGRLVVYSEPPVVVVDNATLTIVAGGNASDWKGHDGRYKCVADNGYSRAEGAFEIEVLVVETPIIVNTASILDFWWIFVIVACILLILIVILICCICILRNRGDKYDVDFKERKNGNDPEKELVASGFQDYQRREIEPFKGSQNSLGSSARLFGDEDASEAGDNSKIFDNGSYHGMSYANTADRKKGRSEYI